MSKTYHQLKITSKEQSFLEKLREFTHKRDTYSLYIWRPGCRTRMFCQELTSKGWWVDKCWNLWLWLFSRFDFIILVFISANCITLAMERPNIPPWSLERKILNYLNHVFTIVFAIEMVLKAIANCYVFGETAYFKDNWNRMDGTLVIISLVGKSCSQNQGGTGE